MENIHQKRIGQSNINKCN